MVTAHTQTANSGFFSVGEGDIVFAEGDWGNNNLMKLLHACQWHYIFVMLQYLMLPLAPLAGTRVIHHLAMGNREGVAFWKKVYARLGGHFERGDHRIQNEGQNGRQIGWALPAPGKGEIHI